MPLNRLEILNHRNECYEDLRNRYGSEVAENFRDQTSNQQRQSIAKRISFFQKMNEVSHTPKYSLEIDGLIHDDRFHRIYDT